MSIANSPSIGSQRDGCDYLMVLRGLSAIAVVFCHLPFELHRLFASNELWCAYVGEKLDWVFDPFGYIPVLLFFSLSGYLITLGFFSGRYSAADGNDLKRYYINRAFRILPLYYFSILLCVVLYWGSAAAAPGRVAQLFIMVENYKPVDGIIFNHVYWTMPIEALYFLMAPFIYLALKKLADQLGGVVAFGILSAVYVGIASYIFGDLPVSDGYFMVDRRQWSLMARFDFLYNLMAFILGGISVFIVKSARNLPIFVRHSSAIKIMVVALFVISGGYSSTTGLSELNNGKLSFFIAFALIPCISLCVLCVAILNEIQGGSAGLLAKCLMHLGTLSYGVYLFHMPVFDALSIVLSRIGWQWSGESMTIAVLCVALLLSQFSYVCIERPFLQCRKRLQGALNTQVSIGVRT